MNIAIIGTGNIGSGLAQTFARAAQSVIVTDKDQAKAADLVRSLAAKGLQVRHAVLAEAVAKADVVILSVPYAAVKALSLEVDFTGKTVIDVTNPVNEDFSGILLGFDNSAAEEIARLLPAAHVVKAFNTVFAQIYDQGLDFGGRAVPTFVASDHATAKASVISLATKAGFAPVDAGPLSNARYIEPLGYLNIQLGYMLGQGTQIAPAWLSR